MDLVVEESEEADETTVDEGFEEEDPTIQILPQPIPTKPSTATNREIEAVSLIDSYLVFKIIPILVTDMI